MIGGPSDASWRRTDDAYVGGDVTSIAPHVAGFVSQILVRDNEHVRAGDVLLRLDNRDFEAASDHAEAVVREQQAALANLTAQYTLQQSLIRQAQADLAAKSAVASFAHGDDLRYHGLLRAVAISRQDVERAVAVGWSGASIWRLPAPALLPPVSSSNCINAQIAKARATVAQARGRSPHGTPQSRLHGAPRTCRRLCRQPRRSRRRLCRDGRLPHVASFPRTDFGWTRISRKISSRA